MCGIIGYIGKKHPKEILLKGLKNLEYRGYDSAGIALKNSSNIQIIKSPGKITNLEEKISKEKLIKSNIGIAHTRWATHGIPSEINAHPHRVGRITLVHNGIIENADKLRKKLQQEGVKFNTQTDTEVACALINSHYDNNIITAIEDSLKEIKGSYAFGIIVEDDPNLYAVRKDSPLIIGIGEEELFIASDIAAIIDYTNKYLLLEENEIAKLTLNSYEIIKNGHSITKEIIETTMDSYAKEKNGYEHYMLKEIMEQPTVIEKTLTKYINNLDLLPDLTAYEEINIVACGSAMYAGMIGKTLLEEKSNIKCNVECASEYRYKKLINNRKNLVILISQSGETADTIAAMRRAKENKIPTLAIVNVKTSTIARESDTQIFIEAGPEIAVATTKAYILQVAIMSMLSYKAALKKNLSKSLDLEKEISTLIKDLRTVLKERNTYIEIAKQIYNQEHVFFIGRQIDYAICLEGSLKLKEISYIHSEAYQAGELKHGTISLITKGTPVIAIITDKQTKDKTISNIEEVRARGAKIISIGTCQNYENNVIVPEISEYFQALLVVPILQLIAYETAKLRNCDIDKPKNLAKSVTVE